jgi:hypothetical protein
MHENLMACNSISSASRPDGAILEPDTLHRESFE